MDWKDELCEFEVMALKAQVSDAKAYRENLGKAGDKDEIEYNVDYIIGEDKKVAA